MPNTAKSEAIRKAYGKLFKGEKIDINGWFDNRDEKVKFHHAEHLGECEYKDNFFFRPQSLQGIENNNGWIRIESEDDLPSLEDDSEFWIANENEIFDFTAYSLQVQRKWENKTLTHYQKVVKPENPIY